MTNNMASGLKQPHLGQGLGDSAGNASTAASAGHGGSSYGQRGFHETLDDDTIRAPLITPDTLVAMRQDLLLDQRAAGEEGTPSIAWLDTGPIDYVLHCTSGLFKGRFLYVNRTSQGEVIGSDKNDKSITLYVENANLLPRHAKIVFNNDTFQYFLSDCGSPGVWLKIRWNRSLEVRDGAQMRLGDKIYNVVQGDFIKPEHQVEEFMCSLLDIGTARRVADFFRSQGVTSLHDFQKKQQVSDPDDMPKGFEDCLSGMEHVQPFACWRNLMSQNLDRVFPDNYPSHKMKLVSEAGEEICQWGWGGGTIYLTHDASRFVAPEVPGSASSSSACIGKIGISEDYDVDSLYIGYSYGRFHMHSREQGSLEEKLDKTHFWLRLAPVPQSHGIVGHWLQPNDEFALGDLHFRVQRFNGTVVSQQGARGTMEDEHVFLQDLAVSNWRHVSWFSVYDGHGGSQCAKYLRQNLHMNFIASLNARGGLDRSSDIPGDVYDSLMESFIKTDRTFLDQPPTDMDLNESGSTAVACVLVGGQLWCANTGDCRAVLCRDGVAIDMSQDHKPDRPDELQRIRDNHGQVTRGRVYGMLAVSRAFGDRRFKHDGGRVVVPDPEIRMETVTTKDEFILLACDGLFDVFTSQEAIDFIRQKLLATPSAELPDPDKALNEIVQEAIHGKVRHKQSKDNVSAILIMFQRRITPEIAVEC